MKRARLSEKQGKTKVEWVEAAETGKTQIFSQSLT